MTIQYTKVSEMRTGYNELRIIFRCTIDQQFYREHAQSAPHLHPIIWLLRTWDDKVHQTNRICTPSRQTKIYDPATGAFASNDAFVDAYIAANPNARGGFMVSGPYTWTITIEQNILDLFANKQSFTLDVSVQACNIANVQLHQVMSRVSSSPTVSLQKWRVLEPQRIAARKDQLVQKLPKALPAPNCVEVSEDGHYWFTVKQENYETQL